MKAPFVFADQASEDNAIEAILVALNKPRDGVKAFLVIGRPGSGKTRFVNMVLNLGFGVCPMSSLSGSFAGQGCVFGEAAKRGFLYLEDLTGRQMRMPQLLSFLTSRYWRWRILRTSREGTADNNTLVLLTGPVDTLEWKGAEDLLRRVKVIHLAGGMR